MSSSRLSAHGNPYVVTTGMSHEAKAKIANIFKEFENFVKGQTMPEDLQNRIVEEVQNIMASDELAMKTTLKMYYDLAQRLKQDIENIHSLAG